MSLEKLKEVPSGGRRHLLCLEVNPPRGIEIEPVFERIKEALEGVDFLNVTDCALAKMKLAALPFAALLKQRFGIEPMVNVSCRDRNVVALQADLLGAWALGVRSIVALTGDAMTVGDSPDRKGVFEINSIGLLNLVSTLNSGKDLAGNELKGHPSFSAGVVVNPNVRNSSAEIKRLGRKRDAGGCYALSQPVFDGEAAVQFFRAASEVGMPLFVGLLPLKNAKAARAISNVPGIKLSDALSNKLEGADESVDMSDFFIEHCIAIARQTAPYVRGFHVVSGASALLGIRLAKALAKTMRDECW